MTLVHATHAQIAHRVAKHGAEYMKTLAPAMRDPTETGYWFDTSDPAWAAAVENYKPPAVAVPVDRWPWAVRIVAKARQSADKGVGDVVARIAGPMGGDAYKRWYMRLVGKPCGCTDRQARLNQLYPFS